MRSVQLALGAHSPVAGLRQSQTCFFSFIFFFFLLYERSSIPDWAQGKTPTKILDRQYGGPNPLNTDNIYLEQSSPAAKPQPLNEKPSAISTLPFARPLVPSSPAPVPSAAPPNAVVPLPSTADAPHPCTPPDSTAASRFSAPASTNDKPASANKGFGSPGRFRTPTPKSEYCCVTSN